MKILVLGVTGMLGHMLYRTLVQKAGFDVHGTARELGGIDASRLGGEPARIRQRIDASDPESVTGVVAAVRPDVVINCIGIIKQSPVVEDPLVAIPINALLPHLLSAACGRAGARLIHISTDCVFSGVRGHYAESDPPDASDFYGKTKHLGEIAQAAQAVTLRTSMIGHGLRRGLGLVEWFMKQQGSCRGFTRAVFSGFTTLELARVISEVVIPNASLKGLYHVSAEPISKFDLLNLIAETYGKKIRIEPDDAVAIDRSLDSSRFRAAARYQPPSWKTMIEEMHQDYLRSYKPIVSKQEAS